MSPKKITGVNRACFEAFEAIHRFPLPVIGAVHGFCLGGGIGIVGSCDIIVCVLRCVFWFTRDRSWGYGGWGASFAYGDFAKGEADVFYRCAH